ncbi:MAG: LuxR C-terminal-related transcriptional regulator [Cyanobium sp.]
MASANLAKTLRCLVVEDQVMFLELLVRLLRGIPWVVVVATAKTAKAGIEACRQHGPDLLILDWLLPDQPGSAVAHALASIQPTARVIVLSSAAQSFVCDASLQPLLQAVVDKIDATDTLLAEISELLEPDPASARPLTPREAEVLALIGQGFTTNRIAELLQLSPHTVSTHRRNLCEKLGLSGGELVRHAALSNQGNQSHGQDEGSA